MPSVLVRRSKCGTANALRHSKDGTDSPIFERDGSGGEFLYATAPFLNLCHTVD